MACCSVYMDFVCGKAHSFTYKSSLCWSPEVVYTPEKRYMHFKCFSQNRYYAILRSACCMCSAFVREIDCILPMKRAGFHWDWCQRRGVRFTVLGTWCLIALRNKFDLRKHQVARCTVYYLVVTLKKVYISHAGDCLNLGELSLENSSASDENLNSYLFT